MRKRLNLIKLSRILAVAFVLAVLVPLVFTTSVPVSASGIDGYTKLMLHCNGADEGVVFTDDSASGHIMTANGHANTEQGTKYFGNASGEFDGNGDDYVSTPQSADFDFGEDDFTVDCWVYNTAFNTYNTVCMYGTLASRGWALQVLDASLKFYYTVDGSSDANVSAAFDFLVNTWHHIAVSRTGGKIYLFADGTLLNVGGTAFAAHIYNANTAFVLGRFGDYNDATHAFEGFIDEFRISLGIARWTTDFAVPVAEYTSDNRYWVGDGGDWSDATNHWALTSGGAPNVANLPDANSTVYVDAASFSVGAQAIVIDAAAVCASIDFTGVDNNPDLTMTFTLTVGGNVTLAAGMTLSGAAAIIVTGSGNFDGAGLTIPELQLNGSAHTLSGANSFTNLTRTGTAADTTLTLAANQTVTGTFTANGNSSTNRLTVNSSVHTTQRIITAAVVSFTNVDFHDIDAAGASAPWDVSAIAGSSADLGNNTDITFSHKCYWVGSSGNWNGATEWSGTSGGSADSVWASLVTDSTLGQSNSVYFDANSFTGASQTVTINVDAYCHDMNWTGALWSPALANDGSHGLYIYGSLNFISAMSVFIFGGGNGLHFSATTSETITTNGIYVDADPSIYFDGVGGAWTLQDNTYLKTVTLTRGTLNTNGKTVTCGAFNSSNANTRVLTLGASIINCSGWDTSTTTNLTFTANTATINDSGDFAGGGLTYNIVNSTGASKTISGNNTITTFTSSGSSVNVSGNHTITTASFTGATPTISGACTFTTLNVTGTAILNDTLTLGANQIVTTTLNLDGNSQTNRLLVKSNTFATARTLTLTGATVSGCSNVDFYDITATPAIDLSAITGGSGNLGGNSGITFTTATSRYWIDNTGNWSDTSHWSATSGGAGGATMPLVQDTAYFDTNSFTLTTRTVTVNVPYVGNIDSSDAINAPTIYSATTINSYGSLSMGANYWTATTGTYFYDRTSPVVSVNGYTLTGDVYTYPYGTTLTLGSELVTTGTIYHRAGTLDFVSYSVVAAYFDSSTTTYARILSLGSGTFTLNGTAATTKWNVDATSFTLSANTSLIALTNATANAQTFTGGTGITTYYGIYIGGAGNYTTTFSAANTFTYIWIDRTDVAKTIAGNVTLTTLALVIPVVGTTVVTVSNVDFSKVSGTVVTNWINFNSGANTCTAGGGATFYAGADSITAPQTGWIFTDAPAPIVSTLGASDIMDNSVVLNGSLDTLDGVASGYVYFQYGTDVTYGSTTALTSIAVVGTFDKSVGGLISGTVYHYRAVFKYSGSTYAYGNDISFTTTSTAGAPLVSTGSASDIEPTTATLNGSIISMGTFSVVYASFEYVLDTSDYGTTDAMTTSEQVFTTASGFTADIAGLSLSTMYHFRARVRFVVGVTSHYAYGGDVTFTTSSTSGGSMYPTITRGAVFCGYLQPAVATGTFVNGTGTATGSPITLSAGLNSITITVAGTFTVTLPSGNTGTAISGGWVVTGSPVSLEEGANTVTVQAGGVGVIYVTVGAGDMLFVAESFNAYTTFYFNHNSEKEFQIQLLDTAGTTVLAATSLKQWGLKPVSIYLDATQVQALNLVWGSAYYISMVGMFSGAPVITPYQLQPEDWYGDNMEELDAWCINTATHMDTYYGWTYAAGTSVLTDTTDIGSQLTDKGGGYFTVGIEGISSVRPDLFVSAKSKPVLPVETASNLYDAAHSFPAMVGAVIAGDFTAFGATVGTTGNTFAGWSILLLVAILSFIGVALGGAKGLPTIVLSFPLIIWGSHIGACGIQWVVVPCIAMVMLFARQFWVKAT